MVVEKLQSVYGVADVPIVFENKTYSFCIRQIKPVGQQYQLLVTDGLVNYVQPVNESNRQLKHIELYFMLPDFWDLSKKTWPIEWLNRIAAVPQKNKTWFGIGDTIPAGNPPAEIDEKLRASYFILSEPLSLSTVLSGPAWEHASFKMLAVIPIFRQEFDFKIQNSAAPLFKNLVEKNYGELVDEYRAPVARKRFMGMF